MEFSSLLLSRRSIRSYKSDVSVPRGDIEKMLFAAQLAPSWKNSQTGRYYVVSDPQKLASVRNALPEFNQKNSANAPVLVITAFEKNRSGFNQDGTPTNELGNEWGAYDLGLQNQNFVMKARELGYDTLIMGIRDAVELRTILGIPDSQEVAAVIALGKRADDLANIEPPKRKALDDIAKFF